MIFLFALVLFLGNGCLTLGNSDTATTSGPAGVFVTTDKGKSWKQISAMPTSEGVQTLSGVSVYRFFEDPQDPDAMYWGSRGQGLFFSYDQGVTWQHARGPLSSGFIYSVQVHPDDKCLLFGSLGSRVYRSEDCSRSWQEIHRDDRPGSRIAAIHIRPFGEHELYIGKANGDLLKSTDNGDTWQLTHQFGGSEIETIMGDIGDANIMYIGTRDDGLYRSDDNGATWDLKDSALSSFSRALKFRRLFLHPTKSKHLYWVSTYGILVSTDAGESWEALKLITSPGSVDIYGFAVNSDNDKEMFYTTFDGSRSTFYRTEDGGATWSTERLPSGQAPTVLRSHPEDGSILYLGFTIPQ